MPTLISDGVVRRAKHILGSGLTALALTTALSAAQAQTQYPQKSITMIVPFAPGGPTDIVARVLGEALSQSLGQQIIVENRPGAAGNIGMAAAARAKPDGYTLLLASTAIAVNTALFANLPYDPFKDFAPIAALVGAPNVLVVRSDSGIKTLKDLIDRAKAKPGEMNYSSPGAGTKSHLTAEQLKLRTGIDIVHVPYPGAGPSVQAVLGGTAQVGSVALAPAEPLIKSGRLTALAVTGKERWFSLPDVPTMIESGLPNFVSDTFQALFAPAGTPPDIVARLAKESLEALKQPKVRELMQKAGFEVIAGGPEQLAARVAQEVPSTKELVAKIGIKPE